MKQALLLTFLSSIAVTQARFGQENIPIDAIRQVQGGAPGVSDTIAGAAISDLLAGTNACDKLKRGDQILSELGEGADAIAAAIGMVAAEKNFNPFNQDVPTICSDPTLPQNALLRGITPLIDPAVEDAEVANALSEQTKSAPLNADGKSVADLLAENGFTNFITQDAAGNAGTGAGVAAPPQANVTAPADASSQGNDTKGADANANVISCTGVIANNTAVDAGSNANSTDIGNVGANTGAGTNTGAEDFGSCDPTMSFEGGRNGRPATEFTFQSNDPAIEANQQEALNPNIITNRICDELTNICNANAAAKATCLDAKAQILALGTRDQSTADAWNGLVSVGSAAGANRRLIMRRLRRSIVKRSR